MHHIRIQPLSVEEWEKYKRIRLDALKSNPTSFASTYEETLRYSDEVWQNRLNRKKQDDNSIMLFAFDEQKIIGLVGIYWRDRQMIKHIAEVHGVFVNPAYRRQGVAKLLMEKIIAKVKKHQQFAKLKLQVNTLNVSAIKLYQSVGFKIVGTLKKETKFDNTYFDDYVMEKILVL